MSTKISTRPADRRGSWRVVFFVAFLSVILFAGQAQAQIFLGSVQGYVKNSTAGIVAGANVTAQVQGKTGAGSGAGALSDSSGFYLITNLDASSGDLIIVSANKSNAFGSANDTADSNGAATANITIAEVPFQPSITALNDTHNNSIVFFDWTSGTDPQGLTTYDVFTLDSTTLVNVSPIQNETDLSFTNHSWSVQTCNFIGCSQPARDSFLVSNTPPPTPTLVDVADTANNTIVFNWTSGGADAEGDATTFNFELDGNLSTGVTAPRTLVVGNGSHTWKVQECDPYECGGFATDTFSVTNDPPSAPTLGGQNTTVREEVTLSWTSGTDPEGAATYDEFQLNSNAVVSNATSPLTVSLSGLIQVVTWRVRTCDVSGACSAYSEASFIRYTCAAPSAGGGGPSFGGGGGGGGTSGAKEEPEKPVCRENWICEPFSSCDQEGLQSRTCADLAGCGTTDFKPVETRECVYEPTQRPITEVPGKVAEKVKETIGRVVEVVKEHPEIVTLPLSLILVLGLIVALGWRREAAGVIFHLRLQRFDRLLKRDPVRAIEKYYHQLKPEYEQVKDSVLPKTKKLYRRIQKRIEKRAR